MPHFAYTILYVRDVEASVRFYERAFGLERKFVTPENDYGELGTGSTPFSTTLAFASVVLAASNLSGGFQESPRDGKPFGIELGFVTDDVEKTLAAALQAGATLAESPKTKPWGQTVAYIRDLDGFLVEICTAMS
jgi:lactoylglutathione lyase